MSPPLQAPLCWGAICRSPCVDRSTPALPAFRAWQSQALTRNWCSGPAVGPLCPALYLPSSHPVSRGGHSHPLGKALGLPPILPPLSVSGVSSPHAHTTTCSPHLGPCGHSRPASPWVTLGPAPFLCRLHRGCCRFLSVRGADTLPPPLFSRPHPSPDPLPKAPRPCCCFVAGTSVGTAVLTSVPPSCH